MCCFFDVTLPESAPVPSLSKITLLLIGSAARPLAVIAFGACVRGTILNGTRTRGISKVFYWGVNDEYNPSTLRRSGQLRGYKIEAQTKSETQRGTSAHNLEIKLLCVGVSE